MATYHYKPNGEKMACVNCGHEEFNQRVLVKEDSEKPQFVPYECMNCHFVAWFTKNYAPELKERLFA